MSEAGRHAVNRLLIATVPLAILAATQNLAASGTPWSNLTIITCDVAAGHPCGTVAPPGPTWDLMMRFSRKDCKACSGIPEEATDSYIDPTVMVLDLPSAEACFGKMRWYFNRYPSAKSGRCFSREMTRGELGR